MKKLIILIVLVLTGCNAGSTAPNQQKTPAIEPVGIPVPVKPIPPMESLEIIPAIESLVFPPTTYFKGFYPQGCKPNNDQAGIVGTCECVQDPVTKEVWLAYSTVWPETWLDIYTIAKNLNVNNICGLSQGWAMPNQAQLAGIVNHIKDLPDGGKAAWLNNNGFYEMKNAVYFGAMATSPYAYGLNLNTGTIINNINTTNARAYGLAINSSKGI